MDEQNPKQLRSELRIAKQNARPGFFEVAGSVPLTPEERMQILTGKEFSFLGEHMHELSYEV